jgi:hypothetical protein
MTASRDAGHVYVRASSEDRRVFEAVAEALGIGEIFATLRHLAYDKGRELRLLDEPRRSATR